MVRIAFDLMMNLWLISFIETKRNIEIRPYTRFSISNTYQPRISQIDFNL